MTKLLAISLVAACSSATPPSQNPPPPWGVPISGGNMIVTHDGSRAIIADADRDRMISVDLATGKTTELALLAGDEPGRLVEDAAGRIHVALRRGGAVVTLDPTLAVIARRPVCPEPRGIAADGDSIDVACSTGELVTLPAAGGDPTRTLHLDRDLRDVLVVGGQLYVTRFRTAELLAIDATGAVTSRIAPPIVERPDPEGPELGSGTGSGTIDAVPDVAWRTIALADGTLVMSHQRALRTILHTTMGGYGGDCGGSPVEDALTVIKPGQAPFAVFSPVDGALPVDTAVSPDGWTFAVAMAGAHDVQTFSKVNLETPDDDHCKGIMPTGTGGFDDDLGAPTSVAYAPDGTLLVYYPELPALVAHGTATRTYALPGMFGYDAGRALFHSQTPIGLACASCHPEGRDDGQIWQFDSEGSRRTQSLGGQILDRGPYHWSGDMADLPTLMDQVFAERMAGGTVSRSQHLSLGPWLDRVPAPQPPATPPDPAAVDRGRTLFQSADVGCGTCHSGPLFTNHTIVDVGTGGAFKVPSLLGVAARPPFLHDGCAATLADRFGTCGGGDLHGHTSQLTTAEVSDLIAYLESI